MAALTTWTPGVAIIPGSTKADVAASNGSEQKGAMEMVIETFWHGHGQNSWLASKSSTQTEKFRMTVMKSHACSVVCKSLWTPWTVAHQAPLSMGFPRQEYWSGLPFPPPGGVFLTQEWNLHLLRLLRCLWILYHWATRESLIKAHPLAYFYAEPVFEPRIHWLKKRLEGTLVVQRLELGIFIAKAWVQSLVRELRSWKHCSMAEK